MGHSCDDPDMCTFDDEDGCDGPYEEIEEAMTDCPFCPTNWPNLDQVEGGPVTMNDGGRVLVIRPLDPVTEGHVLLIHETHGDDFTSNYEVARDLAANAARYTRHHNTLHGTQFNVITSIGPDATQTIFHTHVHVVPRRPHDGLPLPWTGQVKAERPGRATKGRRTRIYG